MPCREPGVGVESLPLVLSSQDLSRLRGSNSLVPFPSVSLHQHLISTASSCPMLTSYHQPMPERLTSTQKILAKFFLLQLQSRCYLGGPGLSECLRPTIYQFSDNNKRLFIFFIHLPALWRLILVPWRQRINYLMFVCIFPHIRPNLHCGTSHPYSMCHNYCFAISHQQKKLLKLHDSLMVSDHNRFTEKETANDGGFD